MLVAFSLLFVGSIVAFWISAISGGGAGLVLIPLLNWFLPASGVPYALTIGTFTSSASRIAVFRKSVNWRIFSWFVPFSIPSVMLGAWLVNFIEPLYLQLVIALFLLANLPQLLRRKKKIQQTEKPAPVGLLGLIGFLAGFVSGLTGATGLLFNRFYLNYGLKKEEIIATRAANEIVLHLIKLVVYSALGLFSGKALLLGLAVALASVLSSLTVRFILPYLSENLFRKIGYAAMVISGFVLLFSTSSNIIRKDHVQLASSDDETFLHWRNREFSFEYAKNEGFEVEIPIQETELPDKLLEQYHQLSNQHEQVTIEKVYRFNLPAEYEFNCKDGKQQQEITVKA